MSKLIYIFAFLFAAINGHAQRAALESPQAAVNAFFKASAENNDSTRASMFASNFEEAGQLNSINQLDAQNSSSKLGPVYTFLDQAAGFYKDYSLAFDEVERSINYYEDIAAVHSLVYQTVTEKTGLKTTYEQFLWYHFDLIYKNDGWLISSVTWINAIDSQPIDDALIQDTIWHTLKK